MSLVGSRVTRSFCRVGSYEVPTGAQLGCWAAAKANRLTPTPTTTKPQYSIRRKHTHYHVYVFFAWLQLVDLGKNNLPYQSRCLFQEEHVKILSKPQQGSWQLLLGELIRLLLHKWVPNTG